MVNSYGRFAWYELLTSDVEGAKDFYAKVVGWSTRDASSPGMTYVLFTVGETVVAGLMRLRDDARTMGATPHWIGYVGVDDVDAAADRIKLCGGAVHVPPTDISNVSRFSVFIDPQTATLGVLKWKRAGEQPVDMSAQGRVGWHELVATDREKALAFYGELFGWQQADADVSALGTYQRFSAGGETIGGMVDGARDHAGLLALLLQRRRHRRGSKTRHSRRRPDLRRPTRVARGLLGHPMRRSAGRGIRTGGKTEPRSRWIFQAGRSYDSSGPRGRRRSRRYRQLGMTFSVGWKRPTPRCGRSRIDRRVLRRGSRSPSSWRKGRC